MEYIFTRAQSRVKRYRRTVSEIGLHKDNVCAAQCPNSLELENQCGGDALATMRCGNRKIVDVNLAALPLKLLQFLGHQATDDVFAFRRCEGNEVIGCQQALKVVRAGPGVVVCGRLLKGFGKRRQQGVHQVDVGRCKRTYDNLGRRRHSGGEDSVSERVGPRSDFICG